MRISDWSSDVCSSDLACPTDWRSLASRPNCSHASSRARWPTTATRPTHALHRNTTTARCWNNPCRKRGGRKRRTPAPPTFLPSTCTHFSGIPTSTHTHYITGTWVESYTTIGSASCRARQLTNVEISAGADPCKHTHNEQPTPSP